VLRLDEVIELAPRLDLGLLEGFLRVRSDHIGPAQEDMSTSRSFSEAQLEPLE
jgi:hypothetical protein